MPATTPAAPPASERNRPGPVGVVRDVDQAGVLLQPERLRLLHALADPDSASGLARRFGLPRQRLNYHLKALEKVGLVEFVQERRKGNCVERVVRASARSYVLSPEMLGALGTTRPAAEDRFSATYLLSVAARIVRDLSALVTRAAAQRRRIATLTLDGEVRFASASDRAGFADELATAFTDLVAKYHTDAPGGRTFRVVVGSYPAPKED